MSKTKQTNLATREGMLFWVIRSPQSSLLARGGVKTPAVKPCIVHIIVLLCSVGSKGLSAYRFIRPIVIVTLLADLGKIHGHFPWLR